MADQSTLGSPASIAAVPAGVPRPLWSVMIPTFNCAAYLRETLRSVLAQDPGPGLMQIEVVDDCSTKDDPAAVVSELSPDGRVAFHRQPANGGAIANFNTCIARSHGHLVHILHGDDAVMPDFYARMGRLSDQHPDLAWFACRALIINAAGELESLSPRNPALEAPGRDASSLAYENGIRTPCVVVRRGFYERLGGFRPELFHTADWEMWVRARTLGGGVMLNAPLCLYRIFAGNDTGRLARGALNLRDYLNLATYLARLVPGFDQRLFRNLVAQYAMIQAHSFLKINDPQAAQANLTLWRELTTWRTRTTVRLRSVFNRLSLLVGQ